VEAGRVSIPRPKPVRAVPSADSPNEAGRCLRPCEYEGCHRKASGGKAYCRDHLHEIPYAAELIRREDEKAKQAKKKGGKK